MSTPDHGDMNKIPDLHARKYLRGQSSGRKRFAQIFVTANYKNKGILEIWSEITLPGESRNRQTEERLRQKLIGSDFGQRRLNLDSLGKKVSNHWRRRNRPAEAKDDVAGTIRKFEDNFYSGKIVLTAI